MHFENLWRAKVYQTDFKTNETLPFDRQAYAQCLDEILRRLVISNISFRGREKRVQAIFGFFLFFSHLWRDLPRKVFKFCVSLFPFHVV